MTQVRFMTQLPNTEQGSWPSFTKGLHDKISSHFLDTRTHRKVSAGPVALSELTDQKSSQHNQISSSYCSQRIAGILDEFH